VKAAQDLIKEVQVLSNAPLFSQKALEERGGLKRHEAAERH